MLLRPEHHHRRYTIDHSRRQLLAKGPVAGAGAQAAAEELASLTMIDIPRGKYLGRRLGKPSLPCPR
jgi:hypothetical protein